MRPFGRKSCIHLQTIICKAFTAAAENKEAVIGRHGRICVYRSAVSTISREGGKERNLSAGAYSLGRSYVGGVGGYRIVICTFIYSALNYAL